MTYRNLLALALVSLGFAGATPSFAQSAPADSAIVCPDPATLAANAVLPPECITAEVTGVEIGGGSMHNAIRIGGGDDDHGGERGEVEND